MFTLFPQSDILTMLPSTNWHFDNVTQDLHCDNISIQQSDILTMFPFKKLTFLQDSHSTNWHFNNVPFQQNDQIVPIQQTDISAMFPFRKGTLRQIVPFHQTDTRQWFGNVFIQTTDIWQCSHSTNWHLTMFPFNKQTFDNVPIQQTDIWQCSDSMNWHFDKFTQVLHCDNIPIQHTVILTMLSFNKLTFQQFCSHSANGHYDELFPFIKVTFDNDLTTFLFSHLAFDSVPIQQTYIWQFPHLTN